MFIPDDLELIFIQLSSEIMTDTIEIIWTEHNIGHWNGTKSSSSYSSSGALVAFFKSCSAYAIMHANPYQVPDLLFRHTSSQSGPGRSPKSGRIQEGRPNQVQTRSVAQIRRDRCQCGDGKTSHSSACGFSLAPAPRSQLILWPGWHQGEEVRQESTGLGVDQRGTCTCCSS